MTIEEFIEELEKYPKDMQVRTAYYNMQFCRWELGYIGMKTILTDKDGTEDLTNKKSYSAIEALVIC